MGGLGPAAGHTEDTAVFPRRPSHRRVDSKWWGSIITVSPLGRFHTPAGPWRDSRVYVAPDQQICLTAMTDGRIRIRMEAYDHQALDLSAREIVDHAKRTGARVAGPIPLPTRREIYTVNRSPFIDKKSREQFEIRTHKRIIDITEPNARTVEALNRLVVPAGVFIKIKA